MSRHESQKRKWLKIKNNPELYKKLRESQRRYNKKYKILINIRQNKYKKEMVETAREIGTCTKCFKERDNPKWNTCSRCRMYYREYSHRKEKVNKDVRRYQARWQKLKKQIRQ